jgi:hypothetical protein
MSKPAWVFCSLVAAAALSAPAAAGFRASDVTVQIVDEQGATFQQVPVSHRGDAYRAYVQADRGARYRIRVSNSTGERVGVVIAVDGRNIVNGARSDLAGSEPKYVLSAYESQEFSGWRTSLADVHEFYFTEWKDSYAEAFGDRSARGVIAVAVYQEKESARIAKRLAQEAERQRLQRPFRGDKDDAGASSDRPAPAAPAASGALGNAQSSESEARDSRRAKAERSEPGTGYGEVRNEPAVRVAFDGESQPSSRLFLKYEWRETLCRKRVLDCREPENRFWPDALSFAPPPPRKAD